MAVPLTPAIFETWNSRRLSTSVENPTAEFLFKVVGTDDEGIAASLVEQTMLPVYVPPNGQALIFQNYELEYLGGQMWDVRVLYSSKYPRGSGIVPYPQEVVVYAFELGQQQIKRTQSLKTVQTYTTTGAGTAPDMHGAIGVNGDQVEGVDVDSPVFTWSETVYVLKSAITQDYIDGLYAVAAAPVNNGPFRGRDAGEVRFLGASGAERDDQNFEITFRFAASPNTPSSQLPSLAITLADPGGGASVTQTITKNGWDYLWVRYQDVVNTSTLVKQAVAIYIEQVYDTSDFSQLGIGTGPSTGSFGDPTIPPPTTPPTEPGP